MIIFEKTKVPPSELKRLNKLFKGVRGLQQRMHESTGLSNNTIFLFLKSGIATTRTVRLIREFVDEWLLENSSI